MKILTIVGARPQFVKAAMISKSIAKFNAEHNNKITEYILHTGQHYDKNMSSVFFSDMKIPKPTYQLNCAGNSHGEMTGKMLIDIEKKITECLPDYLLVYGDTNSTLAGALSAAKMNIPIVHVEAGLRSFNKKMPEEINRVLTDHISTILCCPTHQSVKNLHSEGIVEGVYHVGDVMYDAAITFGSLVEKKSHILNTLKLSSSSYYLATIHRAENTDNKERLFSIFQSFVEISTNNCPVIVPIHPRTLQCLKKYQLNFLINKNPSIQFIEPLSFLDMVMMEKNAKYIFTDSGGVQKEAYFHKVPCITLRDETEWVETVHAGWNQVVGYKQEDIVNALAVENKKQEITEYGDGHAADKIVKLFWQ